MNRLVQAYQNLSFGWKAVCYVIVTIVLGAIGSVLGAGLVKPLIELVLDATIGFLAHVSMNFKNTLYREASKGLHEAFALRSWVFFTGVISGALLHGIVDCFRKDANKGTAISHFFISKGFALLLVFFICLFIYDGMKMTYVNDLVTSSLNSIEIVAPHIELETYQELRSKFYSMRSEADYRHLYQQLSAIADTNSVSLNLKPPL